MAAKYVEDYNLAIRSFKNAHQIGASGALEEVEKILEIVQRLSNQVERKSDLKAKHLKELLADFPSGAPGMCGLKELKAGEIPDPTLVVRVVSIIERQDEVPAIVLCCDSAGEFL